MRKSSFMQDWISENKYRFLKYLFGNSSNMQNNDV